jgi:hypothetical protein
MKNMCSTAQKSSFGNFAKKLKEKLGKLVVLSLFGAKTPNPLRFGHILHISGTDAGFYLFLFILGGYFLDGYIHIKFDLAKMKKQQCL